jgi:hypothetical protein
VIDLDAALGQQLTHVPVRESDAAAQLPQPDPTATIGPQMQQTRQTPAYVAVVTTPEQCLGLWFPDRGADPGVPGGDPTVPAGP